jgi:hypothetical protein
MRQRAFDRVTTVFKICSIGPCAIQQPEACASMMQQHDQDDERDRNSE